MAWAITNAMADYQDVVPRSEAGAVVERWSETVAVLGGPDEPVEVEVTEHGPVFTDGHAFRGPSTVLGDLGFAALLPLLRARSVDDVDRALDHWVEPVNNVLIADRAGAVRYRLAGRVPVRSDAGWAGWVGAHRAEVGPDGQVVSANERRGPESDEVGAGFAPPFRADRIHALLAGRDDLRAADFAAVHRDTHLATVDLLRTLVPGAYDDWDAHMDADSVMAARWSAWRSALCRRIAAEPVFAPLHAPAPDPVHAPWLDVTSRIGLALPGLVAAGTPFGIDLAAHARAALADVDRDDPTTSRSRRQPRRGASGTSSPRCTPSTCCRPRTPTVSPGPSTRAPAWTATATACAARAAHPGSPTTPTGGRSPATSGTWPTAPPAAGSCRSAPREPRARTTTTSSRSGLRASWCRWSPTGASSPRWPSPDRGNGGRT